MKQISQTGIGQVSKLVYINSCKLKIVNQMSAECSRLIPLMTHSQYKEKQTFASTGDNSAWQISSTSMFLLLVALVSKL